MILKGGYFVNGSGLFRECSKTDVINNVYAIHRLHQNNSINSGGYKSKYNKSVVKKVSKKHSKYKKRSKLKSRHFKKIKKKCSKVKVKSHKLYIKIRSKRKKHKSYSGALIEL